MTGPPLDGDGPVRDPLLGRDRHRHAGEALGLGMLAEMSVADVSLNELSRRVGLAKSNVLRYFESREAVLLELLAAAWQEWLDALRADPPGTGGPVSERGERLADALAASLAARPVLCDLLGAQAAVLERNVSPVLAARYKRTATADVGALGAFVGGAVPELGADAVRFAPPRSWSPARCGPTRSPRPRCSRRTRPTPRWPRCGSTSPRACARCSPCWWPG